MARVKGILRHGTLRGYSHYRCRCDHCRTKWAEWVKQARAKDPARYREYSRRWEENNPVKVRDSFKQWKDKNKYWHHFQHQLWKRGLTLDQYHALSERQDFCCAICGEELDVRPTIDHDHVTGRIRGLICMNCNLGLGHFKDNPANLVNAARYLEHYASKIPVSA